MPTDRDYAIATMLGENRGDTLQGLAGVLDVLMNRRASPSTYGATGSSIREIATAGNGKQFNNWLSSDPNSSISNRALNGPGSLTPAEAAEYYRAAQVYDDYMAGQNGYRGITQGATFYQTPAAASAGGSFQNKFYGSDGNNYLLVGKHQFTGDPSSQFIKDPQAWALKNGASAIPAAGSDGFGKGTDVSQGAGDPGSGNVRTPTLPGYGSDTFGQNTDVSQGYGGIGGLTGSVQTPLGTTFGHTSYGSDASTQTPNTGTAVGTDASTGGAGSYSPTLGGPYSFSKFDPSSYLNANPDVAAFAASHGLDPNAYARQHYEQNGLNEERQGSGLGDRGSAFNAQAYLGANSDVAQFADAHGLNSNAYALQHYLENGFGEGRSLGDPSTAFSSANIGTAGGIGNAVPNTYTFNGGQISASPIGSYSPSAALPTSTAPFAFSGANVNQGVGNGTLSNFNPSWYLSQNPDVAQVAQSQHLDPNSYALQHYLSNGQKEGRAFAPGEWLNGSFNPSQYLAQNPDVAGVAASQALDPNAYALQHFLTYGIGEGRQGGGAAITPYGFSNSNVGLGGGVGNPTADPINFNPGSFAAPDLGSVNMSSPLATSPIAGPYDFSNANVSQGLGATGNGTLHDWNSAWYLQNNPDVLSAAHQLNIDPNAFALSQYLSDGVKEGRAFAPGEVLPQNFSSTAYFAANPDVANAGLDPLLHYITNGAGEGRQATTGDTPWSIDTTGILGNSVDNQLGMAAYGNAWLSPSAVQNRSAATQLFNSLSAANTLALKTNAASNQAAQNNLSNLAANPNAVLVPEQAHADTFGAGGAATAANAASNYALAQQLAKLATPLPAAQPVQTAFYGAQPKTGLFGGAGPPGSGFL